MKLAKLLSTLALGAFASSTLADTATVSATGSVAAGCQFSNSTFSVSLPSANTIALNNGTAITQTGTLQIQCSTGVNATLSLGALVVQDVDLDGNGSMDVEARLFSGTTCNNGSWPLSVPGTGAPQDVNLCVNVMKKGGATVPAGSINVSWPINLAIN